MVEVQGEEFKHKKRSFQAEEVSERDAISLIKKIQNMKNSCLAIMTSWMSMRKKI